jgi:amino acid transporter
MRKYLNSGAIFGAVGGLLSLLAFITFHYSGFSPLLNLNAFILELILTGLILFLSILYFKRGINKGELRFWQGMTVGFFAYTTMAASIFIYLLIFLGYIDQSVITLYIQDSIEYLSNTPVIEQELISSEEFELRKKELEAVTAYDLAISAFIKKIITGLLLTPVVSVVLRN